MKKNTYFNFCTLVVASLLPQGFANTIERRCTDKSPDWRDFGGDFCYIIEMNNKVPWIDAVYNCSIRGGSLASFHSLDETDRVIRQISQNNIGLYIGLWKHYDGSLEWVDKSAVDFRNWNIGEPNFVTEKCVEIYTDSGKWNDIGCSNKRGYICSSAKVSSTQLTSESSKWCNENSKDWLDLGGEFCYIIEKKKKPTWQQALDRCFEAGGTLASFHSVAEVSAVLQQTRDTDQWLNIGLRKNEYDIFRWADGSRVDFDYWNSGVSNTGQKQCVQMNTQTGHWSNAKCNDDAGYVCSSVKVNCERNIFSENGSFHSPLYPDRYRKNEYCTWRITVPNGYRVALQFSPFELQNGSPCQNDYVAVFDGTEANNTILGKFCGHGSPGIIHSSGNKMTVRFVTDSSVENHGFYASFVKASYCGGDIVAENGTIASPSHGNKYRPGEKCLWKITVPENHRVSLKFLTFDVGEADISCGFDVVVVRDGHEDSSPLLKTACGSNIPENVRSTNNKMSVLFASDFDTEKGGFTAEFEKDICGGVIIAENGTLSSPNYPGNYRPFERCTWKISVPENYRVAFQFSSLQLEDAFINGCRYDFVEIRDGHDPSSPVLGKFCGSEVPEILHSSRNNISVTLFSDENVQFLGFSASFAKADFCGKTIVAESGVIKTPNFPKKYGSGDKCVWKITVPQGLRVNLSFKTFDVKYSENCTEDYLKVYDGNETSPLLTKTCGNVVPRNIISSGNEMTVVFASDLSEERKGFYAKFEGTCGDDFYSDFGNFTSPNYPQNYENNMRCLWRITVPESHQVVLMFQTFELEANAYCAFDYVEIRDGHTSDSAVLKKLCGEVAPNEAIVSTGNKMSITFVSDRSTVKQGFAASFEKVMKPREQFKYMLNQIPVFFFENKLPIVKENVVQTTRNGSRTGN